MGGRRLVDIAVDAALAAGSRRVTVVGPDDLAPLPASVALTREHPPFGGPAAALAAGLSATAHDHTDALLLLACDMPAAERALPALLDAALSLCSSAPGASAPGVGARPEESWAAMAVDHDGRRQPLLAVYGLPALSARVATRSAEPGGLEGVPLHRLVDGLAVTEVPIPGDSSSDIDTWDDARRWRAAPRISQEHA